MKKIISFLLTVVLAVTMPMTAFAAYDLDDAPAGSYVIGEYIFTDGELTTLRVMDAARTIPVGEPSVIYRKNLFSSGGQGWDIVTRGVAIPVTIPADVPDGNSIVNENDSPITPASNDASITGITVDSTAATGSGTAYAVELPAGSDPSTLAAGDIVVTATDANATVGTASDSSGATDGTEWSVTVTAEDGTTSVTYVITVTVATV